MQNVSEEDMGRLVASTGYVGFTSLCVVARLLPSSCFTWVVGVDLGLVSPSRCPHISMSSPHFTLS